MLKLTGVELLVIIVTAIVQMYCIKNALDKKQIIWYVFIVTMNKDNIKKNSKSSISISLDHDRNKLSFVDLVW